MCAPLAGPAVAMSSGWRAARAAAAQSCGVFAAKEGCAMIASGTRVRFVIGAKSRSGS